MDSEQVQTRLPVTVARQSSNEDVLKERFRRDLRDARAACEALGNRLRELEEFLAIKDSEDSLPVRKTDLAKSSPCIFCQKSYHAITRCYQFSGLTLREKRSYVKEKNLCWLCMKDGHMYRDCPVKDKIKQCSVGGCGKKHPAALFHSLRPTVAQSHQPSADVTTLPPL